MEDLLELYGAPYDPERPVVCLDEKPVCLLADARETLPMRPGSDAKEDYEYVRGGSVTLFGALDFKGGRRLLQVSARRAKEDFAHFVKKVVDELCAGAERVRLVLDNLSTHSLGALYDTFGADEARRLCRLLELHYTPRHGSWLNPVELEFAVCQKQCLSERPGSLEDLCRTVGAWKDERNRQRAKVRWNFSTQTARETLKRIYPKTNPEPSLE